MTAPEQRVLGAYQLEERIGKGGMGEVYRARHLRLGREAAVKILPGNLVGEGDFLKRFEREAASAASLSHPNILQVYDFGEQDGMPYLVMPYIKGATLKDRLVHGQVTTEQLSHYLTAVANALDYAHRKGIIHRDVKPANILIDDDDRPYLADFGIAKALEGTDSLTQAGLGVGTPEYMAPEQAQGRAEPRSDLYALGIMVYQMLTGRVPYSGTSTVEVLMKHLQAPVPLDNLPPATTALFGPILQQALHKDPQQRYASGRDLMTAVNTALLRSNLLQGTSVAPTPSNPSAPPDFTPAPGPSNTPPPVPGTMPPELHRPAQHTPPPVFATPPPGTSTPLPGSGQLTYPSPAYPPGESQQQAAATQLSPAGFGAQKATMDDKTKRILLIVVIVAVIVFLGCCCLLFLSSLSNS